MRSTIDGPDVFFRKMKKKPALQAIIDNLDAYTEEQLSKVGGQPLWIRQCLVNLKQNNGEFALTRDEIADAMAVPNSIQTVGSFAIGEVFEWTGSNAWLGDTDNGIKFEQEVKTGELIFVVSDDACYIGDVLSKLSDQSNLSISLNAVSKGTMSRQQYQDMYRSRLQTYK